jgi:hypothetical protein
MNVDITVNSPFTSFKKVQVDEHLVTIPEAPTKPIIIKSFFGGNQVLELDELIMYRKEDYDNAYWKRDKFPKFWNDYVPEFTAINCEKTLYDNRGRLTHLSVDDTNMLIYLFDREMFRRVHGVHFKNGDEIVYLTGDHYFILMWMKMYAIDAQDATDNDYGKYFEFQRDFLYVVMHAINDPNILGVFCAKPKKTGITQVMAGVYLNRSSITRMAQMGIMSKGDDASKVNMVLFLHGFKGLPQIFKPVIRDLAPGKGYIWFGEKDVKDSRTKAGQERLFALLDAEPLDTRVFAAPTKEAAFDAPKMYFIWFDELPKYDTENKVQPEQVFIRNQETVKVQTRITGKCFITSYPPEKDTPGFKQARKIWYQSKLSTIKVDSILPRTASGLICFYISALNSHRDAFNKYGKCDMAKARMLNKEERDKVKFDKKQYQAKLRQYNENEKECWGSAGAGSTFDNVRLGELEFDLKADLDVARPYIEGRLDWENSLWEAGAKDRRPRKVFGPIKFVKLTDDEIIAGETARLRINKSPAASEICAALRMGRDKWGNLLPLPMFNYYGGADPTEYASGAEVNEGSKNASFTMNFKDPEVDRQFNRIASGIICSTYFYRPDNPEEFYQDLVKEILFFGKRIIVEANKAWVATRLIEDGLGYYMIVRDKNDGLMKPWSPSIDKKFNPDPSNKGYGLIRTGPSTAGEESDHEAIVRAIAGFIVKPPADETDYAAEGMKDERLINQLQDFDPELWKLYDLVMAFGYTLICGNVMNAMPDVTNNGNPFDGNTIRTMWEALTA